MTLVLNAQLTNRTQIFKFKITVKEGVKNENREVT